MSMRAVAMPMAEAIGRFCATARILKAELAAPQDRASAPSTIRQKAMIASRFQVTMKPPVTAKPPVIQPGLITSLFGAPKIERTACCSTRLMPQVASSVSSGRP